MTKKFEVIIIGGSYAGLSAAMALGRSLRQVLVIDSGSPCNRYAPQSHNIITQDGETPATILKRAKDQVLQYSTVSFLNAIAVDGKKTGSGFEVTTHDKEIFIARKLIFATGVTDVMPPIKGFADCWGITVVNCPYCHGYELRNRKTAILTNGSKAFHLALQVYQLTGNITLLTSGEACFKQDHIDRLKQRNIPVNEKEVAEIEHHNGHVTNVVFTDGTREDFSAVFALVPFTQHCTIPVRLGCELTTHGLIRVDHHHQSSVEGVYACGDNSALMRSLAKAVFTGNRAGAMVNKALAGEDF